jgi:hypothetical protein
MHFVLHAPQIVYLSIMFVALLLSAALHGKPRSNINFWTDLVSSALTIALMYWGGFFRQ